MAIPSTSTRSPRRRCAAPRDDKRTRAPTPHLAPHALLRRRGAACLLPAVLTSPTTRLLRFARNEGRSDVIARSLAKPGDAAIPSTSTRSPRPPRCARGLAMTPSWPLPAHPQRYRRKATRSLRGAKRRSNPVQYPVAHRPRPRRDCFAPLAMTAGNTVIARSLAKPGDAAIPSNSTRLPRFPRWTREPRNDTPKSTFARKAVSAVEFSDEFPCDRCDRRRHARREPARTRSRGGTLQTQASMPPGSSRR